MSVLFRGAPRLRLAPLAATACLLPPPPAAAAASADVASSGTNDVTFAWETDDPEPSAASVRPAAGEPAAGADASSPGWRTVELPAATRFHVVEVAGLDPDTAYEYRLGAAGDRTGTFRTLAPPPGAIRGVLYVLTDIHLCVTGCRSRARRLAASREAWAAAVEDVRARAALLPEGLPRAAVILGDLSQEAETADWEAVDDPPRAGIPFCAIPGNHDKLDPAWAERLAEVRARLASPECRYEGSRGQIDLGPWRVVLLDSTGETRPELGEEQIAWLERRLAEAPDRPALLALHHPLFPHPAAFMLGDDASFTFVNDNGAVQEALRRAGGVVAVLSGHVHVNWTDRGAPTPQFILSSLVQFPMGCHSFTLYDGGLVRRFHPLAETAEEARASARELVAWAESRIPLPGMIVGLVDGRLEDRSTVLAVPGGTTAPAPADALLAAESGATGTAATDAAPHEAPAPRPAAGPAGGGGRGSGCRCTTAGAPRSPVPSLLAVAVATCAVLRNRAHRREVR